MPNAREILTQNYHPLRVIKVTYFHVAEKPLSDRYYSIMTAALYVKVCKRFHGGRLESQYLFTMIDKDVGDAVPSFFKGKDA